MPKVVINLIKLDEDISFLEEIIKNNQEAIKTSGYVLSTHKIEHELKYLKDFKQTFDIAIANKRNELLNAKIKDDPNGCENVQSGIQPRLDSDEFGNLEGVSVQTKIFVTDSYGNTFYSKPFEYSYVELTYGNYKKFDKVRFLGEIALFVPARFEFVDVKHNISPTTLSLLENIHKIKEEYREKGLIEKAWQYAAQIDENCEDARQKKKQPIVDWRHFFRNYFYPSAKWKKEGEALPKFEYKAKFEAGDLENYLQEIAANKASITQAIKQKKIESEADPKKENPSKGSKQDSDIEKPEVVECEEKRENVLQDLEDAASNLNKSLERQIEDWQRRFDPACILKDIKDCLLPPDLDFCDFVFKDISIPKFYQKLRLLKSAGLGDLYLQIDRKLEDVFGITELRQKDEEIKNLEKLLEEEDSLRDRLNRANEEYLSKSQELINELTLLQQRKATVEESILQSVGQSVRDNLEKQKRVLESRIIKVRQKLGALNSQYDSIPANLSRLNVNYDEHLRRKGELQRDFGEKIAQNKFNERQAALISQGQNLEAILLVPNEDESLSPESVATTIINAVDTVMPLENICKLLFQISFARDIKLQPFPNDFLASFTSRFKDPYFGISDEFAKLIKNLLISFLFNLMDALLKALCDSVGNIVANSLEGKEVFENLSSDIGNVFVNELSEVFGTAGNTLLNAASTTLNKELTSWFIENGQSSAFSEWNLSLDGKSFVIKEAPVFDFSQIQNFIQSGISGYSTTAMMDMMDKTKESNEILEEEPPIRQEALSVNEAGSEMSCLLSKLMSLLTPTETIELLTGKPEQSTINIVSSIAEICAPKMATNYPGDSLAALIGEMGILAGALDVEKQLQDIADLNDNLPITEKVLCERYNNVLSFRTALLSKTIEPQLALEILKEIEDKQQEEVGYIVDSITELAEGNILAKPQTAKQFYLSAISQTLEMQQQGSEPKSLQDLDLKEEEQQDINIKNTLQQKISETEKTNAVLNSMFDMTADSLIRPYRDRFRRDGENYIDAMSLDVPYEKEVVKEIVVETKDGVETVKNMEFLNIVNMDYIPVIKIPEGKIFLRPQIEELKKAEAEKLKKETLEKYRETYLEYQDYAENMTRITVATGLSVLGVLSGGGLLTGIAGGIFLEKFLNSFSDETFAEVVESLRKASETKPEEEEEEEKNKNLQNIILALLQVENSTLTTLEFISPDTAEIWVQIKERTADFMRAIDDLFSEWYSGFIEVVADLVDGLDDIIADSIDWLYSSIEKLFEETEKKIEEEYVYVTESLQNKLISSEGWTEEIKKDHENWLHTSEYNSVVDYFKERTPTFQSVWFSDDNIKNLLYSLSVIEEFVPTEVFGSAGSNLNEWEFKMVPSFVMNVSKKIGEKTVLMNRDPDFNFFRDVSKNYTINVPTALIEGLDPGFYISNGFFEDKYVTPFKKPPPGSNKKVVSSVENKKEVGQKYVQSFETFRDKVSLQDTRQNLQISISHKDDRNPLISESGNVPGLLSNQSGLEYDSISSNKLDLEKLQCAIKNIELSQKLPDGILDVLLKPNLSDKLKEAIPMWKLSYVENVAQDGKLEAEFSLKARGLSFSPAGLYYDFYHNTIYKSEDVISDEMKKILINKYEEINGRFEAFSKFIERNQRSYFDKNNINNTKQIYSTIQQKLLSNFYNKFESPSILQRYENFEQKKIEFFDFTREQTEYEKENNLDPNIMDFVQIKNELRDLYSIETDEELTDKQVKGEASSQNKFTKSAKSILVSSMIRLCVNEYILKNLPIFDSLSFDKEIEKYNFVIKDISNFVVQESRRVNIGSEIQKQSIKYYDLLEDNGKIEPLSNMETRMLEWKRNNSFSSIESNPKLVQLVKKEMSLSLKKFRDVLKCGQNKEVDVLNDIFTSDLDVLDCPLVDGILLGNGDTIHIPFIGMEYKEGDLYIEKYCKIPSVVQENMQALPDRDRQKIEQVENGVLSIAELAFLLGNISVPLETFFECDSDDSLFDAPIAFGSRLMMVTYINSDIDAKYSKKQITKNRKHLLVDPITQDEYLVSEICKEEYPVDISQAKKDNNYVGPFLQNLYQEVYTNILYPSITSSDDIKIFFKYCFAMSEITQMFMSHTFLCHNDQDARFLFEGTKISIAKMYEANMNIGNANATIDGLNSMLESQRRNEDNTGNPLGPALEALKFYYRTPIQILKGAATIVDPNIALADVVVKGAAMAGNLIGQKIDIPYSLASLSLLPFPLFNGVSPPIPPLTSYNVALPLGPVFLGLEPSLRDLPYYKNQEQGKLTTGDGKQNPYSNPLFCELSDEENDEE